MAAETGNPIPASALMRVGAMDEAVIAGYKALEKYPKSPVLEYIAATIGPEIEEYLQLLIQKFSPTKIPEGIKQVKKYYPSIG